VKLPPGPLKNDNDCISIFYTFKISNTYFYEYFYVVWCILMNDHRNIIPEHIILSSICNIKITTFMKKLSVLYLWLSS